MSYHPNSVLRRARVARGLLLVSVLGLAAAFFRVLAHPWIDRAFETYVLYREPLF